MKIGDKVEVKPGVYADYGFTRGLILGVHADGRFEVNIEDRGEVIFAEHELVLVEAALDNVEHPAHYAHPSGIEVIEITKHESFLRGNILKYVLRAPYKGNELEDMQKAKQYLDWEIERLQQTPSN